MRNNKLLIWLITTSSNPKRLLYLNEHFSRFGKKNNVEVILENITWERIFKALVEGFKFNTGPDIMQIGTSWVRIFTHMGYLAQVPDDIKIKPSINEGINTICKQDGKQYAVPWKADTIIMAGRKDYMLKYGIKERDVRDWEGLKEFGKKFKELREKNRIFLTHYLLHFRWNVTLYSVFLQYSGPGAGSFQIWRRYLKRY